MRSEYFQRYGMSINSAMWGLAMLTALLQWLGWITAMTQGVVWLTAGAVVLLVAWLGPRDIWLLLRGIWLAWLSFMFATAT
jgi:hypothetical protein